MNNLAAQEVQLELAGEMQISGGAEFGFGVFEVDNNFAFSQGNSAYFLSEKTTFEFFSPGINLSVRYFSDSDSDGASSFGFFFRDRAIFITNGKSTGTISLNAATFGISENYSIADDNFISIMDFDLGLSTRLIISKKLQFYFDFGVNFTIMDSKSEDETLDYWGGGLYTALALQVNLTKTMYLEFGINSILNMFSSQKGEFYLDLLNRKIRYEDTGRCDLTTVAAYLSIGWRLDVQKIRIKDTANE